MEPITTYVSSDGKETLISEMNNFHLVNALLKTSDTLSLNPNGFGDDVNGYSILKALQKALKDEVFKRMDNRPQA